MEKLSECKFGACSIDAPLVTEAEKKKFLPQIPNWEIISINKIERLVRKYKFDNFVDALEFTNKIGEVAEIDNHHPAILTEWGSVELSWWSHKIRGLHKNDFILAAKSDQIYDAKFG